MSTTTSSLTYGLSAIIYQAFSMVENKCMQAMEYIQYQQPSSFEDVASTLICPVDTLTLDLDTVGMMQNVQMSGDLVGSSLSGASGVAEASCSATMWEDTHQTPRLSSSNGELNVSLGLQPYTAFPASQLDLPFSDNIEYRSANSLLSNPNHRFTGFDNRTKPPDPGSSNIGKMLPPGQPIVVPLYFAVPIPTACKCALTLQTSSAGTTTMLTETLQAVQPLDVDTFRSKDALPPEIHFDIDDLFRPDAEPPLMSESDLDLGDIFPESNGGMLPILPRSEGETMSSESHSDSSSSQASFVLTDDVIHADDPESASQLKPPRRKGDNLRFPCPFKPSPRAFRSQKDLDRHLATRRHRKDVISLEDEMSRFNRFICTVSWCKRQKEGFARKDHFLRHMHKIHPNVQIEKEAQAA